MLVHLYLVYGCFHIQQKSFVVATETVCPAKLKIFSIWSFTENICQPRSEAIIHEFSLLRSLELFWTFLKPACSLSLQFCHLPSNTPVTPVAYPLFGVGSARIGFNCHMH